jgi:hypothetical protein
MSVSGFAPPHLLLLTFKVIPGVNVMTPTFGDFCDHFSSKRSAIVLKRNVMVIMFWRRGQVVLPSPAELLVVSFESRQGVGSLVILVDTKILIF